MTVSVVAGSYCPPTKFAAALRSAPKNPLNPGPAKWVRLRIVAGSIRTGNISTPGNPPLLNVTAFRFVVPALPPGRYLVAEACPFPPSQACAFECGAAFQIDALPSTDVAPPSPPSALTTVGLLLLVGAATLGGWQWVMAKVAAMSAARRRKWPQE